MKAPTSGTVSSVAAGAVPSTLAEHFALIRFSASMRGDSGNLLPSISTVSMLTSACMLH